MDVEMSLELIRNLQARKLAGEKLTDDELRSGITAIAEVRASRAGKKTGIEPGSVPFQKTEPIEDIF